MAPSTTKKHLIVRNISYDVPESARELVLRVRRSLNRAVRDFFDGYFIDVMSITDRAAALAEKLQVFIRENYPKLVEDYNHMAHQLNRHIDAHPCSGLTSFHFQRVDVPGQQYENDKETSDKSKMNGNELYDSVTGSLSPLATSTKRSQSPADLQTAGANKAPQEDSLSPTIMPNTQSTKGTAHLTTLSPSATMIGSQSAFPRPHSETTSMQSATPATITESLLTSDGLRLEANVPLYPPANTTSVGSPTLRRNQAASSSSEL